MQFSIVINTNGRCSALRNTLESLCFLDYPSFEICVVNGPTNDGTGELLASYAGGSRALPANSATFRYHEILGLRWRRVRLLHLLMMIALRNQNGSGT